jgi:hypothetical protein
MSKTKQAEGLQAVEDNDGNIVVILDGKPILSMVPMVACRFAGRLLNVADRRSRKKLLSTIKALPGDEWNPTLVKEINRGAVTVRQAVRARRWAAGEVYRSRDLRIDYPRND